MAASIATKEEEVQFRDAVWNGYHVRVASLLDTGKFDRNKFRHLSSGATHLHAAAYRGHENVVKVLLDHNADTTAKLGNRGATPLELAVKYGRTLCARILVAVADAALTTMLYGKLEDYHASAEIRALFSQCAQKQCGGQHAQTAVSDTASKAVQGNASASSSRSTSALLAVSVTSTDPQKLQQAVSDDLCSLRHHQQPLRLVESVCAATANEGASKQWRTLLAITDPLQQAASKNAEDLQSLRTAAAEHEKRRAEAASSAAAASALATALQRQLDGARQAEARARKEEQTTSAELAAAQEQEQVEVALAKLLYDEISALTARTAEVQASMHRLETLLRTRSFEGLDVGDVGNVLREIGLGQYTRNFLVNKVDGVAFQQLDDDELRDELGLKTFSERKVVQSAISNVLATGSLRATPAVGARGDELASTWDESGVGAWLATIGMGAHAPALVHAHVCGWQLLHLNNKDLRELGVTAIGERKRLLAEVERLRATVFATFPKKSNDPQPPETPAAAAAAAPPPPSEYLCPITQLVMRDPVLAADGFLYERTAIEQWLEHHSTSPMANLQLPSKNLTPCYTVRSATAEWLLHHADK
eukprot:TRINITY_DN247_c0_g2_i2.p1 TRINITY_DN247_c0_g2~~TRINITY_DN247_c0_g2_i2.p1  ORF type:complete len:610 (+),score=152.39 TRINITY_DN247_c0_g2_i2:54-1832(+)